MTFRRGTGDIVSREIVRIGQDVVVETRIVGPEVNVDLANNPLHPPNTSFREAPEVEESIRREDVRRSRMSRMLMDTERKRNTNRCILTEGGKDKNHPGQNPPDKSPGTKALTNN